MTVGLFKLRVQTNRQGTNAQLFLGGRVPQDEASSFLVSH